MMSTLDDLDTLLEEMAREAGGDRTRLDLTAAHSHLKDPLRVLLAGRIKSGKSTLLNALVGEPVAPTDAAECTKHVTMYRHSHRYLATVHNLDGTTVEVPMHRNSSSVDIDLSDIDPTTVAHLEVQWPTKSLEDLVVIDTPGIDGSTKAAGVPLDATVTRFPCDAVLYLLGHVHPSDAAFLDAFRDPQVPGVSSSRSIAVLSRADEIGNCESNAMDIAARLARRLADDPAVGTMCGDVVAVAGLLAQGAGGLTQGDYDTIAALAAAEEMFRESLSMSVHRLLERPPDGISPEQASALVARLGWYGVRTAVDAVAEGRADAPSALGNLLAESSGVKSLHTLMDHRFRARVPVLKIQSAVRAATAALDADPALGSFAGRLDQIVVDAHELREVVALERLRAATDPLPGDLRSSVERVLGAVGASVTDRLDLAAGADDDSVRAAAQDAVRMLRTESTNPLWSRGTGELLEDAVRSAERVLAQI